MNELLIKYTGHSVEAYLTFIFWMTVIFTFCYFLLKAPIWFQILFFGLLLGFVIVINNF